MRSGNRSENKTAAVLRELGYLVAKLRHEEGPGDLIALGGWAAPTPRALLVEVKGTWEIPWSAGGDCFGPERRRAMIEAGERYWLEPILAWWSPGGRLIWIPPEDWPK